MLREREREGLSKNSKNVGKIMENTNNTIKKYQDIVKQKNICKFIFVIKNSSLVITPNKHIRIYNNTLSKSYKKASPKNNCKFHHQTWHSI